MVRTYCATCCSNSHLRSKYFRWLFLLRALCLLVFCSAFPVHAAPQIEALQRLNFGIVAITSNAAPSSFVLSPSGSAAYGTGFVFVGSATPGRYKLTGYPAFTNINLTMDSNPLSLANGTPGEILSVSAAIPKPMSLRTDQNGQVEFNLGATLTTSGSSFPYQDGIYIGSPTLTLNFTVAAEPVLSYQEIEVDLELRTSLVLVQVEALDFGRLAVFSSPTDESSIRISPNGGISILNPGAAKIVRFGGEKPATFQISTGAAYAPIQINLPSESIYLTHQSQSSEVARLRATDFATLPMPGDAKLNAQGALEFRLGATLRTELTTKPYQDGVYSGTFPLTVEY
jgi:hypothetical protein